MMQISTIGSRVIFLDACDSTNAESARISGTSEAINGTVVLAYEQTAGRGRRGNSWTKATPTKTSRSASCCLKPAIRAEDAFLPVAAAAVACAEYLSEQLRGKKVQIKWPNDILCEGRKISGMLIENTFSGNETLKTIVGIGINLNGTEYAGTRFPATSYARETGSNKAIAEAMAELLPYLNTYFTQLFTAPALLMGRYNALLYGKTEYVPLAVGSETVWAKFGPMWIPANAPLCKIKTDSLMAARSDEIQFCLAA